MTHQTFTVVVSGEEVTFSSPYTTEEVIGMLAQLSHKGLITGSFAGSLLKQSRNLSTKQVAWVHKLVVDAVKQEQVPVAPAVSHNYTEAQQTAIKQLTEMVKEQKITNTFARDLVNHAQNGKQLTEKQLYWVERLISDETTQSEPTHIVTHLPKFTEVIKCMDKAATKIKTPKMVFDVDDTRLVFSRKVSGFIFVKVENMGYLGAINTEGTFKLYHENTLTPQISEVMSSIAANPVAYVTKYGLGSGHCCFCNRPLCDERALAMGYGKTCAGYYGFPWGNKKVPQAKAFMAN